MGNEPSSSSSLSSPPPPPPSSSSSSSSSIRSSSSRLGSHSTTNNHMNINHHLATDTGRDGSRVAIASLAHRDEDVMGIKALFGSLHHHCEIEELLLEKRREGYDSEEAMKRREDNKVLESLKVMRNRNYASPNTTGSPSPSASSSASPSASPSASDTSTTTDSLTPNKLDFVVLVGQGVSESKRMELQESLDNIAANWMMQCGGLPRVSDYISGEKVRVVLKDMDLESSQESLTSASSALNSKCTSTSPLANDDEADTDTGTVSEDEEEEEEEEEKEEEEEDDTGEGESGGEGGNDHEGKNTGKDDDQQNLEKFHEESKQENFKKKNKNKKKKSKRKNKIAGKEKGMQPAAAQSSLTRSLSPSSSASQAEELHEASFAKLQVWGLEEYARIVYLDNSCIVRNNRLSELFELDLGNLGMAAAPGFFPPHHFDAGVLVLKPNTQLLRNMLDHIQRKSNPPSGHIPTDNGHTSFLNSFFPQWWDSSPANRLAFEFNTQDRLHSLPTRPMNNNVSSSLDQACIINFSSFPKPWEWKSDSKSTGSHDICALLRNMWWDALKFESNLPRKSRINAEAVMDPDSADDTSGNHRDEKGQNEEDVSFEQLQDMLTEEPELMQEVNQIVASFEAELEDFWKDESLGTL